MYIQLKTSSSKPATSMIEKPENETLFLQDSLPSV